MAVINKQCSVFKKKDGFTLVELAVILSISLILAAASVGIYGNLNISSQLNENTSLIIQTVRAARQNSVSRLNNSSYGVKLEQDRYVLYQGGSYQSRDANYDREAVLDKGLSLSTNLANNEINFSKQIGAPDNSGTITLTHQAGGGRIIAINNLGMIEEN